MTTTLTRPVRHARAVPPRVEPVTGGRHRRRRRSGRAGVITALAGVLVFVALVVPRELGQLTPLAFVRIPVEALIGLTVLIILPSRTGKILAACGGLLLGVLTVVRMLDMGFRETLVRPFDPVLDWVLLDDAWSFLADSVGPGGATSAAVVAVAIVIALLVLMTRAVLRLTRVAVRHRMVTARAVAVLSVAWLVCAALGAQLVAPVPVASRGAAALLYQKAVAVPATIKDEDTFTTLAAVDAFRDTPPDRLLAGLRGKDVVLTFVESYGRTAVEDPRYAREVDAALNKGTGTLAAAGFSARSGWLTSPVAGGGSWLAHATFSSGLWIDNQQRDRSLTTSDRLTLTSAFQRADWRTVAVMPGNTTAWPEAQFYGFDHVDDARTMGYRGLNFSWSPMPDQYALARFQKTEYGRRDRGPLMSEVVLTSSHVPWTPVPKLRAWKDVRDGTENDAAVRATDGPDVVWQDPERVRDGYRDSIVYSVNSLISWVQTYGDDNLVLVFLGDHQPSPVITGQGASRDVPITVVARDPKVLDRIDGWGWTDGLKPAPQAPVWKMDAFRDRFFTAFGDR
jgi:hypothetical protein